MSFSAANLFCTQVGVGGGPSRFQYRTTDAHTDVDATDYFASGIQYGMKVYDEVVVIDTDTATCTLHYVSAVDSDGNATIAAATLS